MPGVTQLGGAELELNPGTELQDCRGYRCSQGHGPVWIAQLPPKFSLGADSRPFDSKGFTHLE